MFRKLKRRLGRNHAPKTQAPVDPMVSLKQQLPDADPTHLQTIIGVQPYTMTSPQRILALCEAVDHVARNGVQGCFVECGVWRGGSMAAAAKTLVQQNETDRSLWLYDTFDGMSEPTERDVDCWGYDADQLLAEQDRSDAKSVWCVSALDEVKAVMQRTGYPESQIKYIEGKVEDTLPQKRPEKIAILRLDTDWYESTKCELEYLFPLLEPGGVLIIDDYGHWKGCRKAVDEYFRDHNVTMFLNRIDYTGRLGIKLPHPTSQAKTSTSNWSHVA